MTSTPLWVCLRERKRERERALDRQDRGGKRGIQEPLEPKTEVEMTEVPQKNRHIKTSNFNASACVRLLTRKRTSRHEGPILS